MEIPTPNEYAKKHGFTPFPTVWERFLNAVRVGILTAQGIAGHNVSIDVYPGEGTVYNISGRDREPIRGGGGGGATGACCTDGECSILSQSDCEDGGGNYLGDDSTCDDVDCTQGACCNSDDGSCFLYTSDCAFFGPPYSYLGDGTVCDPNPCPQPPPPCCGFDAFDGSGRKFLTRTSHLVGYDHVFAPFPTCSLDYDITTTDTYNTGDCSIGRTCSGSSVNGAHTCPWFFTGGTCAFGSCDQGPLCNVGIPGDCNPNSPFGTPTSATTAICTAGDSGTGFAWSETLDITLSDERDCSSMFSDPFFN